MTIKSALPLFVAVSGCLCQQNADTVSPFACNLKALNTVQRAHHSRLTDRLVAAVSAARERPDGYALQIDPRQLSLEDLAQWVDLEQKCCPFFDFTIQLRGTDGSLWLWLEGRSGVKPFIESEFPRLRGRLHPRDVTP